MKIEIHHYNHYPELQAMSEVLDNIAREVAEAKTAHASAIALIAGLKTQLDQLVANATELGELKAAVSALSQDLSDSTDSLAAAVETPPQEDQEEPQA